MHYAGDISWPVLRSIVQEWAGSSADIAEVAPLDGGNISSSFKPSHPTGPYSSSRNTAWITAMSARLISSSFFARSDFPRHAFMPGESARSKIPTAIC